MVREALHERATVLKVAPHLSYQMPIMLPIYKWWQVLHMLLCFSPFSALRNACMPGYLLSRLHHAGVM